MYGRDVTECPGCGFVGSAADPEPIPPPDRYASPRCWGRYEELLSRSYGIAAYRRVHQLVVDVYVAQHPGGADVLVASDADDHERLVRTWGAQVWRAWEPHHAVVRDWNRRALGPVPKL